MCVFVLDIYRNAIKTDPGFIVFMAETEAETCGKWRSQSEKSLFLFLVSIIFKWFFSVLERKKTIRILHEYLMCKIYFDCVPRVLTRD